MTQSQDANAAPPLESLPLSALYGDYAVGTAMGFAVDNSQRFDPWNTAYASPAYRDMLRRIEASGQTRTVVFQMWHPAEADKSDGRLNGPRSPYPAADGRRATLMDSIFQDVALAQGVGAAYIQPQLIQVAGGGTLADAPPAAQAAMFARIGLSVLTEPDDAYVGAQPAAGKFPLIILSHGLGGSHSMWASFAEFLASHGYVVAAPSFISDGGLPLVFHDEDSPFAKQAGPEGVRRAHQRIQGEYKVLPSFYRMMFDGYPSRSFDPGAARAIPGGAARATAMMRNLMRQRVADVALLTRTMRLLGEDDATCRVALASMGATSAARDLCGRFAGMIDGERAGFSGHSLGSMTSALAANHLPGANAAMGFNNGLPFAWTPPEMFGAGETDEGLPVGSRAPLFIMIGDEDAFVQNVFIGIFQNALSAAGGDPTEAFPLESERAVPDRIQNPQPVALSAYRRAVGDRAFAIVRDMDHDALVSDFARNFPWPEFERGERAFAQSPRRVRKPTGEAAYGPPGSAPAETYALLGWAELGDGGAAYMPHLIRDWHARAWFDWHLKGDQAARARLLAGDPFGPLTAARAEEAGR